jgi:serine/threonine protein phosphatase PrpC
MRIRSGIELAGLSDIGCLRADNEDRYAYWEASDQAQFDRRGRLAIIADGMGGCEGGQEASRIAVETVERVYRSAPSCAAAAFITLTSVTAACTWCATQRSTASPEINLTSVVWSSRASSARKKPCPIPTAIS